MQVVRVEEFGEPGVLKPGTAPDPVPGPGEAVVDVSAADVMFLDTLLRSGWGGDFFPLRPPYVPGSGVAGRSEGRLVVADTTQTVGGRDLPMGGYASRAVVATSELIGVPDGLDDRSAVALLHDGPTIRQLLARSSPVPGTRVLVTAATGGAGVLLVQELRRRGVDVVAAARGEAKLALLRSLDVTDVVDYGRGDWAGAVGPVDTVLDGAGGDLGTVAATVVADGGLFVSYGTAGGRFAEPDPDDAARRGVTLVGLTDLPAIDRAERRRLVERTLAEAAAGHYRPVIGQTFPLDRAADAHAAIAARTTIGKTLLIP